ncbi:MAG: hypothetical protein MUF21_09435 [Gemmatimonadaceae bacterium]|nr:hypothetical protein [Gemmatimonadaceae bacterium]MCU0626687.1 hypothetical protein [Gemmatimonadaceae bacterium]
MTGARRTWPLVLLALSLLASACRREQRTAAGAADTPRVVARSSRPVALDTAMRGLLQLWTLPATKSVREDQRRLKRVVEHLQADIGIAPGFVEGGLLAAGDGRTLLVVLRWADSASLHRARPVIARWLGVRDADSAVRKAAGSATPEVVLVAQAGAAPLLVPDSGVLVLDRFARRAGRSLDTLLALVNEELGQAAAADSSLRGGVVLLHADSGAIVRVLQARAVNGMELPGAPDAPAPAWAPFATREQRYCLVVSVVRQRGEPVALARPPLDAR